MSITQVGELRILRQMKKKKKKQNTDLNDNNLQERTIIVEQKIDDRIQPFQYVLPL